MLASTTCVLESLRRHLTKRPQWSLASLFLVLAVIGAVFTLLRIEFIAFQLPSSLLPGEVQIVLTFPRRALLNPWLLPVTLAIGCTVCVAGSLMTCIARSVKSYYAHVTLSPHQ